MRTSLSSVVGSAQSSTKCGPMSPRKRISGGCGTPLIMCIGYAILGRNAQAQMHMIRHGVPFDQLEIKLIAKLPQDAANIVPKRAEDCFLPIFRYDDHMVAAIPFDMTLTLPFSHGGFSL